ncbi:MAG TPA: hypothetical protein PLZ23_02510 [Candidatus Paceibacterota bacterium]|nr:hypothetical protein [Candidatus Paceibacterota bacterium]HQB26974.1 hypothetical protein [Candidatus Paceibacterota bacterium]
MQILEPSLVLTIVMFKKDNLHRLIFILSFPYWYYKEFLKEPEKK